MSIRDQLARGTPGQQAVAETLLTLISHQLAAADCGAPRPAVFSRLGVLDLPQVPVPHPWGRKPHCALRLAALARKPGEICGLNLSCVGPNFGELSVHMSYCGFMDHSICGARR